MADAVPETVGLAAAGELVDGAMLLVAGAGWRAGWLTHPQTTAAASPQQAIRTADGMPDQASAAST